MSTKEQFPVKYEAPPSPLLIQLMSRLPLSVRRWFGAQVNAPRTELLDARAATGDSTAEVYPVKMSLADGKVWRIGYEFQSEIVALFKEVMNIQYGPEEANAVIENAPEEIRHIVKKDTEKYQKMYEIDCKKGREGEYLKQGLKDRNFMMVVKLENATGGLLLYSPVRIHEDMRKWLAELGPVEWIVLGSSAHTTNIKRVAEQYPQAKIVGSEGAERKLRAAGMSRSFDYYTSEPATSPRSIAAANAELHGQGAEIISIDGDVVTNAILVLAHKQLLETDVAYGHHDKTQTSWVEKKDWLNDDVWFQRHYFYEQLHGCKCPNGCLPSYRFQFMDENDPLPVAMGINPRRDDRALMAASLRNLLAKDFEQVLGVHFRCIMPADEFRKSIDAAWGWLDETGNPLNSYNLPQ
mmetsp:Transcript_24939/g.46146  ORF Transcript_24939/g.46146 Transcript_24939/m.46146 type:complete len:409 (-) Transcript_24939:150-1376(-)